jgi:uncharacterized protein (TIGR03663 family)
MRARLAERPRGELVAYGVLLALALTLRLIDLGHRPFHHDESQDAYFSWLFYTRGDYSYDPLLHGPLRFFLTALMYLLFGVSDFTARLAPALMGTLMVGLPYLARKPLGRVAAFSAAVLLAVGPSFLYFSRFAREDIYTTAITLGLIVVILRFLDAPRGRHPALMGGLLAASFATKESTFITVFVLGTYVIGLVAWGAKAGAWRQVPLVRAVVSLGREAWAWGVASFALVFTLLFTVFLTDPGGLWAGLHDGLAYWLAQQPVARGGEPVGFYVFLLGGVEWPVVALAAVGVVEIWRSPSVGRWMLVWMFAVSLAVYSWASEKFAWLVLHPLLPLVLIAGIGVQSLWAERRRWTGRVGLGLALAGAAYLGWTSFQANALHSADPRELLVSTQSSQQVLGVRDEVRATARRYGDDFSMTIDSADGATFPWAWYFRDLPGVGYVDESRAAGVPQGDVLLLTEVSRTRLRPLLQGYDGRRFDFRIWWVKDYAGAFSAGNWVRWATRREPWNPTGGLPEWIYVKRPPI